mmetsp:Transcript_19133/g.28329  ORF Transcript_19133/g.28329 Transcript_19133/m.28329 type:complete len:348 (-) Transcript_19133:1005-2048(-)
MIAALRRKLGTKALSLPSSPSLHLPQRQAARSLATEINVDLAKDMDHAVDMVRSHDPAGYLPGKLLPTQAMTDTYYASRSFWVETGLRFGTTAKVEPNASPAEHIEWWQGGIDEVYSGRDTLSEDFDHPTLRLVRQFILQGLDLSKDNFDDILSGRRRDIDLKQYDTLQSLKEHARLSCTSLFELVLEAGQAASPTALETAKHVGTTHGLTNALRLSIPVMSTTGKLIVPEELTTKYGVKSPRYLLSSLGLGDEVCRAAFHNAIRDIVMEARDNLKKGRDLRQQLLEDESGERALPVFLPALASETFLDRLEEANYDLTDRNLRNVGLLEHGLCAAKMTAAYYRKSY